MANRRIVLKITPRKTINVIVSRYPTDNLDDWRRSEYHPTSASIRRVDALISRIGIEYSSGDNDGNYYVGSNLA